MTYNASGNVYYPAYGYRWTRRLFGCDETLSSKTTNAIPILKAGKLYDLLRFDNSLLIIPPFRMEKHRLTYINPRPLKIAVNDLPAKLSRIVVVHNFQVEDCNSNLQECLAGIFLAGLINGKWEEPENHPIECRTIEIIGGFNKRTEEFFPL
jgi:hypothetical protein